MGREDFSGATDRGTHRRPYLGRGLFAGGVVLVLVAIAVVASASIAGALGLGTTGARELAGVFAGIGLAGALVGGLAIVPTDRSTWYRGVGGAVLALCGVGAFLVAYPTRWYGDSPDLAFSVLAVYALGVVTTASYCFAGVADLARRVGRAEALAAAVSGAAEATNAGETEPNETGETAGATEAAGTEGSGGEVLYERDEQSDPPATAGNESEAEPATTPTIDRIEPAAEVPWPDSSVSIEPVSVDDPIGSDGSNGGRWTRSGASGFEFEPRSDEKRRGERSRAGRSGRTALAIAGNGAGVDTIEAPATDATASASSRASASTGASEPSEPSGSSASSGPADVSGSMRAGGTRTGEGRGDEKRDDEGVDSIGVGPSVDRYCGNCGFFQYVRTDEGLSPYCGYHEEVLEDMEPCLGWTRNS